MEYDKAYFAVFSLKSKIQSRVHNCDDSVILEILEFAGGEVESFQEFAKGVLEKLESRLFTDIEDAASSLEKALDSFFSVSQSESRGDGIQISMNLKQEIGSFSERVKTIKAKMEEYDGDDSSRSGKKPKMVGLSDPPRELVHWARNCVYTNVAIYGMAGIGKTTLAKEFFHDQLGLGFGFDCRAWVTVGQNPQLKEIIRSILDQVNPDSDKMLMEGDENISEYLKESLRGRRYLIVIDDVWDEWVVEEMCCLLPDYKNSSAVLYTTRLEAVTKKFGPLKGLL